MSGASGTTSRLGLAEAWGKLRSLRFNQDQTCFVAALDDGLRVFYLDPIREMSHLRHELVGSVSKVEMLYKTNLIAFVGGGKKPRFPENNILVYDDRQQEFVMEVSLPESVLNIRLKRDKLIAVCRSQIHVFSFPNRCKLLFNVTTRDNPKGICELSSVRLGVANLSEGSHDLMVFPGYKTGSVQILNLATTEQKVSSAPVTINAHKTELAVINVNQQGTMIATASVKGTLIRIWDSIQRVMLVELRRGSDPAILYCLNFSPGDEWLCCSSDKGTVHVFALQDYRLNKRSALASIGVPGAYAGSQWSLASFTVPQEVACVCAFGTSSASSAVKNIGHGVIFAVCLDGSFHKYHFSANGVCNQVAYDVFTDLCEDCEWLSMLKL
eukprot:03531.XXX_132679_133827_1 [CDS] Oithona nana genome sequencing.